MVFSTIIFLCAFLPITMIGYYLMPEKLKNYFLLFMSLFFYAWGEPKFVWIMIASVLLNYGLGMWIASCNTLKGRNLLDAGGSQKADLQRKIAVTTAVVLNIGVLFVFKYLTFTMETIQRLIPEFPVVAIALPIGISFYTFQGLSYVIDVYRGEQVQRNPFRLALYISMFPQLIAGPIVRYKDVADSLVKRVHSLERFAEGVRRFTIGLAKKAILANMTGELANSIITGEFSVMSTSVAWLGAIAYTLQIYFDFSGYSDMAIGLGKIFGFEFMENFNYPYISRSVREFWRRWHISLSGWFRDYLYIPLGGSRRGNVYLNLAVVFLATGIWHGADWGFLLWGIWHGFFILVERFIMQKNAKRKEAFSEDCLTEIKEDGNQYRNVSGRRVVTSAIQASAGWLYTMFVVVIGWVLFGIVDVSQFIAYVKVMFGANAGAYTAYGLRYYLSNQMSFYMIIAILACVPWKRAALARMARSTTGENESPKTFEELFERKKVPEGLVFGFEIVKRIAILALLILCFVFVINSSYNPFIYFRF